MLKLHALRLFTLAIVTLTFACISKHNAQQSRQSKGRQSRLSDYVDELGSRVQKQEVPEEVVLVLVDALGEAEEHVRHPAEHDAFAETGR